MGLLKNRLRTIIGEDAGFGQALSSLFVYTTNPQRITRILKKISSSLFSKKISYKQWLQEQSIGEADTPPITSFYVVGNAKQRFDYPYCQTINAEAIQTIPQEAYILFADDTDHFHPAALQELNTCINENNQPDMVTFDFDYYRREKRYDPQFNPAWSPQRLNDHNYLQNAVCIQKKMVKEGLEPEDNGVDSCYRILHSLTGQRIRTAQVKKVLLSKSDVVDEEDVELTGITLSAQPLISIIIPTFNKSHLVKQCIESIIETSTYPNYELILVDNRSTEEALLTMIDSWKLTLGERFNHVKADYAFNFSRLMNDGAKAAKGEYLLLLNNDTEVISPDWMEELLAGASQPLAGCMGAKLLYPNNTIQHAGIALSSDTISRHIYHGKAKQDTGYRNAINSVQNYLAVTAACLMIAKEKYWSVSGFSEAYEVEYNDIDFCLRVYEKGYYNAYIPYAELYHYESASRQHPLARRESFRRHQRESALMQQQWQKYIHNDPFINLNAVTLRLV